MYLTFEEDGCASASLTLVMRIGKLQLWNSTQ